MIVVIDTNSLASICFFSNVTGIFQFIGDRLEDVVGENTNFQVVFAFDSKTNFRKDVYPQYKANRKDQTAELRNRYVGRVYRRLTDVGFLYGIPSYEADDICASYLCQFFGKDNVAVITGDKDLFGLYQLGLLYFVGGGKRLFVTENVYNSYYPNVPPERFYTYKALVGDRGDNIPGIKGIGRKKAIAFLEKSDEELTNMFKEFGVMLKIASPVKNLPVVLPEKTFSLKTLKNLKL